MKFCAGITLYNPENDIVEKLNNLLCVFDKIFIYDNSETINNNISAIINQNKIQYYTENKNNGLAISYNYFIDMAISLEFDYLCVLDQDSEFSNDNIKNIKNFIMNIKDPLIAIIAPKCYIVSSKRENMSLESIKVDWVINSGSFLNLKLLNRENLRYDENYFLDRLDRDFCMNIKRVGYKIVVCNTSILEQELGYSINNKYPAHIPIRHYYIFRDRLYFNNKYYNRFKSIELSVLQSLKHILFIILYEDNKRAKFIECFHGLRDFKRGKRGKK